MSEEFGRNLKMVLGKRGITQKQLAALIGSTPTTVGGYCNGRREPTYEMLGKIATTLNVSCDVLCGLTSRIAEYEGKISKAKARLLQVYDELSEDNKKKLLDYAGSLYLNDDSDQF